MYHQARTSSSELTASRKDSSLRFPRVGARTRLSATASAGGFADRAPGPGEGFRLRAQGVSRRAGRLPAALQRQALSRSAVGDPQRLGKELADRLEHRQRGRQEPHALRREPQLGRQLFAGRRAQALLQLGDRLPVEPAAGDPPQRRGPAAHRQRQLGGRRLDPDEAAGRGVAGGGELVTAGRVRTQGAVGQATRAHRPRGPPRGRLSGRPHGNLGRTSADVDDCDRLGQLTGLAGGRAEEGERRLLAGCEDPQPARADPGADTAEIPRQTGTAQRRRTRAEQRLGARIPGDRRLALQQRGERLGRFSGDGREEMAPLEPAPQAPVGDLGDQQPGRVGADVDHPDDHRQRILSDRRSRDASPAGAADFSAGSANTVAPAALLRDDVDLPEYRTDGSRVQLHPVHRAPAGAVRPREPRGTPPHPRSAALERGAPQRPLTHSGI